MGIKKMFDQKEYSKKYREKHGDKLRKQTREWCKRNKCGFNDIRALTIDHIDNNGAEERRRLFGDRMYAGTTFYRWLRKNGYPNNGYQILCFNCNWIKKDEYQKCQK